MSMVVQHNMQAANANRMLGITSGAQAKSTEKLSSGYKINRAADDAAGLTISEKMRKQIRGLDKASSNAQDGVSSVQTAEGALTEVHSMLQRMNELAVQAANGTNSKDTDRKAIQDEIDQLNTEIDRVAETTKFNEIYLLKGDDGEKTINLKAHDAGLKGTLTDNGDGTATFTMKTLNAGDTVSIGGKNYTIGGEEAGLRYLNMDQFHRNIIFLNHLRYFFNKFRIHDRHLREIHGYWHRTMSFPDLFLLITKYFIQNKQVNHMHQIVMFQHRNKHPRSHNAQFIIQLPDQCLRALCAPCVDIHFRLQTLVITSVWSM